MEFLNTVGLIVVQYNFFSTAPKFSSLKFNSSSHIDFHYPFFCYSWCSSKSFFYCYCFFCVSDAWINNILWENYSLQMDEFFHLMAIWLQHHVLWNGKQRVPGPGSCRPIFFMFCMIFSSTATFPSTVLFWSPFYFISDLQCFSK